MSIRAMLKSAACAVVVMGSAAAFAGDCNCGTSCKSSCTGTQSGCCGCGALNNVCTCCNPGETCKSGKNVFGYGYASCTKAS